MSHRTVASFRSGAVLSGLLLLGAAWAATPVEVRVLDPDGEALPGAVVTVAGTAIECVTAADGRCRLEAVPPGQHDVVVRLGGFLGARSEVSVRGQQSVALEIGLQTHIHLSESVTVSPDPRDSFDSYQPTQVLAAADLQQNLGANIGETLGREAGVNTRSFGPGPSRPVIRGLDGDRVLVLENGARTGDLSSQSGDHGVTLDPAAASQIEVVRGPATLLYGSSALGGVVNVISEDIPTQPVKGAHGAFTLQGGTANDEGGAAGHLLFGNGAWALRLEGAGHRTGDARTPTGAIPNSQSDLGSGGAGLSLTGETGYVGASYEYVDTHYGIPFVEEGETTLNPRRHRLDLRAERRELPGLLEAIRFVGAYRSYAHDEIEGDGSIATSFENRFGEGQLFLKHRPLGRLQGTLGVWGTQRDFRSAGEESLAPPTIQKGFAVFLYEELPFRHVSLQFGGRIDHTSFDPDASVLPDRDGLRRRRFTELSGSAGLLAHLRDDLALALNVARAARNPSLEELYNFGPHAGNFSFEIGNSLLDSEVGTGVDLSLRYRSPRLVAEASVFRNSIDDFIFAFPTGEVEDDLPVVSFLAADSLLQGFELHADVGLTPRLWVELGADGVRGELRSEDQPLPRMPPYRAWLGLRYQTGALHVEALLRGAARQDRVFGAEQPTPGYAVVDLHGSYTFTRGETAHVVTLRLDNAGDELYRNHLSFIKARAPEMGRSLKLVYTLRF